MNEHAFVTSRRRPGRVAPALLAAAVCGQAALPALAGPACSPRRAGARAAVVAAEPALVVAPFAVPVAVPVATLSTGGVWYQYAPLTAAHQPIATAAADSAAAAAADAPHEAATILEQRCAACHSGSEAKGGRPLFDDEGALRQRLPRQHMLELIERGAMPPRGQRLSDDEIAVIRRWAQPPRDLEY